MDRMVEEISLETNSKLSAGKFNFFYVVYVCHTAAGARKKTGGKRDRKETHNK